MAPTKLEQLKELEKRMQEADPDAIKEMLRPTRTDQQQREMDERAKKIEEAKRKKK